MARTKQAAKAAPRNRQRAGPYQPPNLALDSDTDLDLPQPVAQPARPAAQPAQPVAQPAQPVAAAPIAAAAPIQLPIPAAAAPIPQNNAETPEATLSDLEASEIEILGGDPADPHSMAGLWAAPEDSSRLLVITSQEHERSGQRRVLVTSKDGPMKGAVFRVVKGKSGAVMCKECKGYNKMGKGKAIFSERGMEKGKGEKGNGE
eukprot:g18831.t1